MGHQLYVKILISDDAEKNRLNDIIANEKYIIRAGELRDEYSGSVIEVELMVYQSNFKDMRESTQYFCDKLIKYGFLDFEISHSY